jgi:hypothetical protein
MSSPFLTKLLDSKTCAPPTTHLLFPPLASSQVHLKKLHFKVESRPFLWNYVKWLSSKTPAPSLPNSKVVSYFISLPHSPIYITVGKPSTRTQSKRKATIIDDSSSETAATMEESPSKRQKTTEDGP